MSDLAEGGMSRVYRCRQLGLDRDVAIKFLKPSSEDGWGGRFEREARVLATLSHPNLVTVYEFGQHDGFMYLVMELVDGVTLEDEIARSGRLEPSRAVRLSLQIADGLAECHSHGIVHRDLKPSNVLVTRRGSRVKVIDFGVAKQHETLDAEKTGAEIRVGSPRYMSPEQVAGDAVSARSDIYAMGCVMYAMLSGRPPFGRGTGVATMLDHVGTAPDPISKRVAPNTISPALESVVMQCLEKTPERRFPSMEALAAALRGVPESQEISDTSSASALVAIPNTAAAGTQRSPKRWIPAAVVVCASLVGAAAAVVASTSATSPSVTSPSTTSPSVAASDAPTTAERAVPRPAEVPTPGRSDQPVVCTLSTVPPGARVEIEGRLAGTTPYTLPLGPSEIVDAVVTLDGYEPMRTRLFASVPRQEITLIPVQPSSPRRATARPSPSPPMAPTDSAEERRVEAPAAPASAPVAPEPSSRGRPTTTGLTDNPDPWASP